MTHNFYKHGLTNTPLHKIWMGMKKRCYQVNSRVFQDYGGKGIVLCDEWKDSFLNFSKWASGNGYKEGLTIERKNPIENYSPSNCCWIKRSEQNLNTRKSKFLTFNGQTKNLLVWSRETEIGHATILYRLNRGWTVEQSLTIKPVIGRNQSNGIKTL